MRNYDGGMPQPMMYLIDWLLDHSSIEQMCHVLRWDLAHNTKGQDIACTDNYRCQKEKRETTLIGTI